MIAKEKLASLQKDHENETQQLRRELEEWRARVEELNAVTEKAAKDLDEERKSSEQMSLRHQDEVSSIKKVLGERAKNARKILAEKEEEIRGHLSKIEKLEDDIENGASSDRKIFEFAKQQSGRDRLILQQGALIKKMEIARDRS